MTLTLLVHVDFVLKLPLQLYTKPHLKSNSVEQISLIWVFYSIWGCVAWRRKKCHLQSKTNNKRKEMELWSIQMRFFLWIHVNKLSLNGMLFSVAVEKKITFTGNNRTYNTNIWLICLPKIFRFLFQFQNLNFFSHLFGYTSKCLLIFI